MNYLNVGYNNVVAIKRIIAIVNADAKPIKRLKEQALKEGRLIDATNGRRTRSLIIMDDNHVVLSSATPETLLLRLEKNVG